MSGLALGQLVNLSIVEKDRRLSSQSQNQNKSMKIFNTVRNTWNCALVLLRRSSILAGCRRVANGLQLVVAATLTDMHENRGDTQVLCVVC